MKVTEKQRGNSLLITRHYPDLGSASDYSCPVGNLIQPIRNTVPDLGSDALSVWNFCAVSQKPFGGGTSGSVAKCRLFSQASVKGASFFCDKHSGNA